MRPAAVQSPPFVAGLDGLRALAVLVVLAFHLQLEWASGGFLGVSLFFTLSGFLITQLLIREHVENGRIDVLAFWIRRLRRLMPAAVLVIVAVAGAAIAFDRFPSERLRGDLGAALGYGANWRFMTSSTSYADLFTSTPSPVLHFWSLAIEEQFYIVFPLVMAGLFAVRRRWMVPFGLGGLLVASVTAGLVSGSQDTVYYATHVRAAEILAGSVLALVLPLGGFTPRTPGARLVSLRSVNSVIFGGALAAFLALVATVETGDSWLYSGGLASFSVLSLVLIVGVQSPGPLRWLACTPVAVWIGGLSYGVYLFHWPVFLLLTEDSTSLTGWSLHSLRLGTTVLLAWVSSILVEQPVRRRLVLRTAWASATALVVAIVVAIAAIVAVPRTPTKVLAGLDAPETFVDFSPDGPMDETIISPLRILVVGSDPDVVDLVRDAVADGGVDLNNGTGVDDPEIVDATDPVCALAEICGDVFGLFDIVTRAQRPDVVVVGFGDVDRQSVRASMASLDAPLDAGDAAFFDATKAYVDGVAQFLSGTPTVFVDFGPADAMTAFMEDVALRTPTISAVLFPTAGQVAREIVSLRASVQGDDDRERVMVIGDSTSYGVSVALDRLRGDRIDVLWAGGQNCPLVDVAEVRWWEGVTFDVRRCPTLEAEWREALDSFEPSLVMIAVSVPEQADQRYPNDETWHEPGSEIYREVHAAFIDAFMAEMTSRNIRVVILDSPAVHGGALGGAPFASAARIAVWNDVIAQWASRWPELVVVPWAEEMAAFEPSPGSLRGDGVHLLQDDLDDLVERALIPLVDDHLQSMAK